MSEAKKTKPGDAKISYEVITQVTDDDSEDIIVPLPEPLLKKLGWKEGDDLDIALDENGQLFLRKL